MGELVKNPIDLWGIVAILRGRPWFIWRLLRCFFQEWHFSYAPMMLANRNERCTVHVVLWELCRLKRILNVEFERKKMKTVWCVNDEALVCSSCFLLHKANRMCLKTTKTLHCCYVFTRLIFQIRFRLHNFNYIFLMHSPVSRKLLVKCKSKAIKMARAQ